ncbi:MAG: hypothetical protein MUF25_26650 [Pirellulaceae bacterium]|nr:hypothetical protein [Pirellulaceae bacterium]
MLDTDSPPPPSAEFLGCVSRAQRSLYAFILTLVRQPADAEDVLQETNLVLWQKAAEFDATRDFQSDLGGAAEDPPNAAGVHRAHGGSGGASMSARQDERLESLLNDLADGTLSDEGELQLAGMLRADAAARRQYRQFLALHADLHWDYAAAVVSEPEKRIEVRRERPGWKGRAWHRWTAALLLLVLVAGGFLLKWRGKAAPDGQRPVIGRLSSLAGEVQIVNGEEVRAVSRESEVHPGAAIHVVGMMGLASLRLDDATEISLAGETRIECRRDAGQTTITLHEGYLSANVMPQAAGHPLHLLALHVQDEPPRLVSHHDGRTLR